MDVRFPYAAKATTKAVGILIGGGMSAFAVWSLVTGAVIARRGNTLSPAFSTAIWVFVLVVGILLLVWGVRMALAGKRTVVVTGQFLEAPRTLTARGVERVPIAAITKTAIANDPVQGQMLHVEVHGAKPLRLAKNGFDDAQAFAMCNDAIAHARATPHP